MNIKVGQKVFVTSTYNRNAFAEEPIVTKVGRKYFELSDYPYVKFDLETGQDYRGEYNLNYQVYESKEAYDDTINRNKLSNSLSKLVTSKLKYSTLLAIQKLIEDDKNNK